MSYIYEDLLYYDETSPSCLRWKVQRKRRKAGDQAGGFHEGPRTGYYRVSFKVNGVRRLVMAHRIIWEMLKGSIDEGMQVDHIDGDKRNNKIHNLRLVKSEINKRNRGKCRHNKSGKTGVCISGNGQGRTYANAFWSEGGKLRQKRFSVDDLGELLAMELAYDYRDTMIATLNEQGAGYTDRHGKDDND